VSAFEVTGTVDQADVRRHHLRLVLGLVRAGRSVSRGDIIERTGLTKTTVTSLVAELQRMGVVREAGTRGSTSRGRPARLLEVNGPHATSLVAEVNIDRVVLSTFDLTGQRLTEQVEAVPESPSPEQVVRMVVAAVSRVRRGRGRLTGAALAVPAMLDPASGTVRWGPHLGWQEVPLAAMVRAATRGDPVPVVVDRLVNFSAIAEHAVTPASGRDVLLLYGDIGIGSCYLSGGQIMRGANGLAGEVGHLLLDPDGPLDDCGRRGCAATLIGLGPLVRDLGMGGGRVGADGTTAPELLDELAARARSGAPDVLAQLDHQGRWLARVVTTLLHLTNPSDLLLGGYFTTLAPLFWPAFSTELAARALPQHLDSCQIRISGLGADSVRRGAQQVLADRYLSSV
jgi:predicted NBD/HSP70 family sugar kinase